MNEELKYLWEAQEKKGWNHFLFGIVNSTWIEAQNTYLKIIKRHTTKKGWISQLIHQVWVVVHKIWEYRNYILHATCRGLHKDKKDAIDRAIQIEFIIGADNLPPDMESLFRENMSRVLSLNLSNKMQ